MFKPNKITLADAQAELEYIKSINAKRPGKAFNHSPDCFAEYCNMQANAALYSGHRITAMEMLQYRDIAKPDYRTAMARAYGNETIGSFSFSPGLYDDVRETLRNELN